MHVPALEEHGKGVRWEQRLDCSTSTSSSATTAKGAQGVDGPAHDGRHTTDNGVKEGGDSRDDGRDACGNGINNAGKT